MMRSGFYDNPKGNSVQPQEANELINMADELDQKSAAEAVEDAFGVMSEAHVDRANEV